MTSVPLLQPGREPKARLLFVENREKTRFYAEVAKVLAERGHAIHWMVQNPVFGRGLPGTVHRLPFPAARGAEVEISRESPLWADRGRRYFAAGSGHYAHYQREIGAVIDAVDPTLVIGESTLFHELMAIVAAEARGIAFVHPAAERYPDGRFAIFAGATQVPYVESGDAMDPAEAEALARRIATGSSVPGYMRVERPAKRLIKRMRWLSGRMRVLGARLHGERYNTPSAMRKWALARGLKSNLERWNRLAAPVRPHERAILYPLQMEPETNIDTWGRPFADQVETIRALMAAAPAEVLIAVKANPKPKYEVSNALLELAAGEPRVRLLPVAVGMIEAMSQCLGAVTVCGTVGYEAACGKGRCLSLRHPVLEGIAPGLVARDPAQAVELLLGDPDAGVGSVELGRQLITALAARSFPGLVSDSFSDPACLARANAERIAAGLSVACRRAQQDRQQTAEATR